MLRPVGPFGPRVYWLRRAVLLAILAVIIIVIAEACSGGSKSPSPRASNTPKAHPHQTNSSSPPVKAAACTPSGLTLALSTDSGTYTSGQAPKLTGVFTNSTSTACKLTVSPSQEFWTVTSGTDTIWTTRGCTQSQAARTIKIAAGATKMVSIFWNGHRLDSGCTEGVAAAPGTYHLSATLDGVTGTKATFHITSATP